METVDVAAAAVVESEFAVVVMIRLGALEA